MDKSISANAKSLTKSTKEKLGSQDFLPKCAQQTPTTVYLQIARKKLGSPCPKTKRVESPSQQVKQFYQLEFTKFRWGRATKGDWADDSKATGQRRKRCP